MWKWKIYLNLSWTKLKKSNQLYEMCLKRRITTGQVLMTQQPKVPDARRCEHKLVGRRRIGPMGVFLTLVPLVTLGLGTWQVKRRKWKKDLIADLKARTSVPPIELPYDLFEIEDLEYRQLRVRGHFDHSRELFLGPRSLLKDGDAATEGSLLSKNAGSQTGYCVITPFHLADRDLTILVNRGWVPSKNRSPDTRREGQVEGEVELVGVVRLNEKRAPFMPQNQPDNWFYRDLTKMAEATESAPVFLDATAESTVQHGPVGGQTRVMMRNEHLSYILTWYGLSAVTSILWYRHFILRTTVI